ncbi:MAG: helix-turn-helix domain-containing protein [Bacteroidales bacterium]|nr:helix-turn-helix domain-containing protein [Bacteroidales bacterium]
MVSLSVTLVARDQLRFKRYTMADGLPASRVTSMCEDGEGNVWMNTWNGLCKWDGEKLTGYVSTVDGQRFGRTTGIQVLKDGRLFFTNDAKQRHCFDPETRMLCPVPAYPDFLPQHVSEIECVEDELGLSFERHGVLYHLPYDEGVRMEPQLHHFFEDRSGQLWIDFNNTLYRIWFEPSPFYYHMTWPIGEHRPFQSTVRALHTDRNGRLLAASRNFQIYGLNDSITRSPFPGNAYRIVDDERGRLWFAMRKKGLYVWTPETGIIPAMDNLNGQGLSDLFTLELLNEKYLLAGSWGDGVRVVSIQGDTAVLKQTLISDSLRYIHKFFKMRDGRVGACSTRGLHIFSSKGQPQTVVLQSIDIMDAEEVSDGRVLVCTMGRGQFWLLADGTCEPAEDLAIEDRLSTIFETPDSMLWLISDTRVYRFDYKRGKIEMFDENDFGLPVSFAESTVTLYQDSLLLIGASSGMMEINLNMINDYVKQRRDAANEALKERIIIGLGIGLSILAVLALISWMVWHWFRLKRYARPIPQVRLGEDTSSLDEPNRQFLEKLTRVMNDMISRRDADISHLAAEMEITKNELYVRCNEVLNATPAAILQDMRIEYAKQLLKQGNTTVKEVAFLVGFNDPKYFSKVFKAKVGVSPSQVLEGEE